MFGSTLKIAAVAVLVAGTAATGQQANRQDVAPTSPSLLQCAAGVNAAAVQALIANINTRVSGLRLDRQSDQDLEAAILYEISLHRLCPGVARTALVSLSNGTGGVALAASQVMRSLLPSGNVGTAGLANGAGGTNGSSFFSAPVVGIGGGTSNYSR